MSNIAEALETPSTHQGSVFPARKYESRPFEAFFMTATPMPIIATK